MARIGVFICHCGTNIAGTVDIEKVLEAARQMPMVKFVDDNKYTCSDPGQTSIREAIIESKLDRVVIGACTPRTHLALFHHTVQQEGLNPHLLEFVSLRDNCAWVHADDPVGATGTEEEIMAEFRRARDEIKEKMQEVLKNFNKKL